MHMPEQHSEIPTEETVSLQGQIKMLQDRLEATERRIRLQRNVNLVLVALSCIFLCQPARTNGDRGTTLVAPFKVVDEAGKNLFEVSTVAEGTIISMKGGVSTTSSATFKLFDGACYFDLFNGQWKGPGIIMSAQRKGALQLFDNSDNNLRTTLLFSSPETGGGMFVIYDKNGKPIFEKP